MAATSCGSMLNRCSLTTVCTADWSKYQAMSIKLGMNQFSLLFSQKAEASMVGICSLYCMILQEMHFNGDCCFRVW